MKRILSTPAAPQAIGPYSQAVEARGGRTLFLSGQIPLDPATGELVAGDIDAQTTRVMENLRAVLAAGGAEPRHLVRLNWYVVDMDEYLENRKALGPVYREIIGRHFPAMAVMQIVRLVEPAARLEIEGTAVV